jgi:transcription initiation factor TFIID subunit 2
MQVDGGAKTVKARMHAATVYMCICISVGTHSITLIVVLSVLHHLCSFLVTCFRSGCTQLTECCPFEMVMTVERSVTVVCSLPLVEELAAGKHKKTLVYRTHPDTEVPARAITFAAGPFVSMQDPSAPQKLSYHCLPGPHAEQVMSFSTQFVYKALQFLEQLTSCPLPTETYSQVFVDSHYDDVHTQPSLTMASCSLLHDSTVIEQSFDTARKLVHALVQQWFGLSALIRPESWQDVWLINGLAGHVTNLCMRKLLGNNAYTYHIWEETEAACSFDVVLCSNAPAHPHEHLEERKVRKAALVMRLVEKRIGEANFRKLLAMLLKRANENKLWYLNMERFFKMARKCSGMDVEAAMNQWYTSSGCPKFTANFFWNKKKSAVEFAMRVFNNDALRRKQKDTMTVRVYETEVTHDRTITVDDEFVTDEYSHFSKVRRNKREKEMDKENESEVIQEMMDRNESPLLWMRIDPEMMWIRKVDFQQADFMWVFQLYKDKNVAAQVEAIRGLCAPVLNATAEQPCTDYHRNLCVRCLAEVLDDSQLYHKVRSFAASRLAQLKSPPAEGENAGPAVWIGVPALLNHMNARYIDPETGLPRPNKFAHIADYFVKKSVIEALAAARETGGQLVTADVFTTLFVLLKHNDNACNEYSDGEYIATLIRALARSVTDSPAEIKKMSKQLLRYMRRDWLIPSFGHAVTCAALDATQYLQARKLMEPDLAPFLQHAKAGQSPDVRCAAFRCIARMAPQQPSLLRLLFNVVKTEPFFSVRHGIIDSLLDGPAHRMRTLGSLNAPTAANISAVEMLWEVLNEHSAWDIRQRYSAATLYHTLLGTEVPECMRYDCPELEFHANEVLPVPSAQELSRLRAPPVTIKVKLKAPGSKKSGDKRKPTAVPGMLPSAATLPESLMSAEKRAKLEGLSVFQQQKVQLEMQKEAEALKAAREKAEREKRREERERTQAVTTLLEPLEMSPQQPSQPRPNWPLDNPVKLVKFTVKGPTPPEGRGNTPPPEGGWGT